MEGISKALLLAVLLAAKERSQRDWLMCIVSYWHGLRASELLAITRDDVQDGYLTVGRKKGSERTVQALIKHENPLLDERFPLQAWAAKSNPNQTLFRLTVRTWERRFKRLALAAGVPGPLAHPHVLKHTIAHHLIDTDGVKLHEVKKRLGHASLQSTGEYLKIRDSQADAAAARIRF